MPIPAVDNRSTGRRARDEQIAAEPQLAPLGLPPDTAPLSLEAYHGRLRRRPLIAAVLLSAMLIGCQREPTADPNTKTLKVKVSAAGEITVDGKASSLDELAASMADLKNADGMLLYHRENPEAEPHENALKVMQMVIDNRLAVRLCATPDFSDAVDNKGISHPRK